MIQRDRDFDPLPPPAEPSVVQKAIIRANLQHLHLTSDVDIFFAALREKMKCSVGLQLPPARPSAKTIKYSPAETAKYVVESFYEPFLGETIVARNRYCLSFTADRTGKVSIEWNCDGNTITYSFSHSQESTHQCHLDCGVVGLNWSNITILQVSFKFWRKLPSKLEDKQIWEIPNMKTYIPIDNLSEDWLEKWKEAPKGSALRFDLVGDNPVRPRITLRCPKDLQSK